MKTLQCVSGRIACGVSAFVVASLAVLIQITPAHAEPVTIDWVTVGDAGNANDTTGYGAVNYEYQIGKYDVTIGQYTAFLNAVATTDTYAVYSASMASNLNVAGIARAGASGSYTYSVINNGGDSSNRPITFVSWWDSARFSNWMANDGVGWSGVRGLPEASASHTGLTKAGPVIFEPVLVRVSSFFR